MNKIKQFFEKHLKLSIFDISLSGIFIGVWIVTNRFLTIDFGIMQTGITYAIVIIVGLYFKPLVGILIAVIADTISISISTTGIGFWMWEYAIIYPAIILVTCFMKKIFIAKNEKLWLLFSFISFIVTVVGAILVASLKDNFVGNSKNGTNVFDFSKEWSKILIWVMISVMVLAYSIMFFLYRKNHNNNLKIVIMVYSMVSIIIIIFIWIWGPYADIRFIKKFYDNNKDFSELYNPAIIARILKTPIILPLYTIIIYPLYKIGIKLKKHKIENKWN